jgi:hypothetical protein
MRGKHNSRIMCAWTFQTTAGAIEWQRRARRPRSHDAQSERNVSSWHFSDLAQLDVRIASAMRSKTDID